MLLLLPMLSCQCCCLLACQSFSGLPGDGALDLLQLAMNCSSATTAATAAAYLPALLEEAAAARLLPEAARKLLLTAATRQHLQELQQIIMLPCLQQHVDASLVAAMLQQVMDAMADAADQQHPTPASDLPIATMELLCKLPAAAQLPADAAMQLLLQAVQQRLPKAVAELASMVVGQRQLNNEQLTVLLESSLSSVTDADSSSAGCMHALCYIAEKLQLSSAVWVQLLLKAIELEASISGSTDKTLLLCVAQLCKLTAAQQLSTAALAGLLQAGAEHDLHFMPLLLKLPAAANLTCEQIVRVLNATLASSTCSSVFTMALCEVPAAQHLSDEEVLQLLEAAVASSDVMCLIPLCQLPAATHLSSEHVLQLLEAASSSGKTLCTAALCQLLHS
jgi:hypothetical protein